MNLQGYRTVITFGIVTITGIFGHHLPPEVIQEYAGDVIQLVGILGILLRMVSNSPFGQKQIANLEQQGVSKEDVDKVLSSLPAQADFNSLVDRIEELKKSLDNQKAGAGPAAGAVGGSINA